MIGDLTVVTGSMFSGKSTELLRMGKDYEALGARVIYCRPEIDSRYSDTEIVSHAGDRAKAVTLPDYNILFEPKKWLMFMEADVIIIDEAQFYGSRIVTNVKSFLDKGKTVVVGGLDLDFRGVPFGYMGELMAIADEVVKLHTDCAKCGSPSYVSYRKAQSMEQVVLGSKDKYEPMCRQCFSEKMHGFY